MYSKFLFLMKTQHQFCFMYYEKTEYFYFDNILQWILRHLYATFFIYSIMFSHDPIHKSLLLLSENIKNMCNSIYEYWTVKFCTTKKI